VALTVEKRISVASLPAPMRGHRGVAEGTALVESGDLELGEEGINLDAVLAQLERQYLQEALRRTEGHKTQAAQLLGMSFRSFRYRLAKLGLEGGESDGD
jgi:DNA-binding NtrC family response regulator